MRANPIFFALRPLASLAVLLLLAGSAQAGVFGGFGSGKMSYLKGSQQICEPVPVGLETAAPRCRTAKAGELAALKLQKPKSMSGPKSAFRASAAGTRMTVTPTVGDAFSWSSIDPIVKVDAVYLSETRTRLAVEFQTRMGGRVVDDLIVFILAQPKAAAAAYSASKHEVAPKRSKALTAAIRRGHKQLKRKRWAAAEKAFRKALAEADDPEARYGAAVALARRKKLTEAVVELEAIAASTQVHAPRWKVLARHDKAFRKLVANKRFRSAVGIDTAAGTTLSAYERLVGATNRWEQSEIKCDRPRVNLKLRRRPQTFKLVLKTTCGGYTDRTKLSGSWKASGADQLELTLPNPGGKGDEVLPCSLVAAKDASGEDVLTCAKGTGLEMTLRTVRR